MFYMDYMIARANYGERARRFGECFVVAIPPWWCGTRRNSMIAHVLHHGWLWEWQVYKMRANMWMMMLCNTTTSSTMCYLKLKRHACNFVFVVPKVALSRAIHVLWHFSLNKYHGGCEMGNPLRQPKNMWPHQRNSRVGLPKSLHHHDSVRLGSREPGYLNIQRDQYGFIVANFNCMDGKVHSNSFTFPLHCQQVFFSNDPMRSGWKIVCWTNLRVDASKYKLTNACQM